MSEGTPVPGESDALSSDEDEDEEEEEEMSPPARESQPPSQQDQQQGKRQGSSIMPYIYNARQIKCLVYAEFCYNMLNKV